MRSFRAGTSSITLIIDFVDRIGSRRMLVPGLGVNATTLFIFGRAPSYSRLLLATALLGLANSSFILPTTRFSRPRWPLLGLAKPFRSTLFRAFLGAVSGLAACISAAARALTIRGAAYRVRRVPVIDETAVLSFCWRV
jgi:hypothetical protein